jgi:peroxiredoxin
MALLSGGDTLPDFTLKVGDRDSISLPSDIESDFAVILFYRGHW